MTRITPRTCLWPLTGSLILTFGLSLGLTFRSNHHCYAGTCGEWLFPFQARLHVVVWYCWISLTITFLAFRAFLPSLQRLLRQRLITAKVPLVAKHLTISGALVTLWILSLYGILIGIWWAPLDTYFSKRGEDGGVNSGNSKLAAIAQTGHLADVTMGMVLLPVSRHSALASFFKLSVATTLFFHMMAAYILFALVFLHGILYTSWVPNFTSLSATLQRIYPILNPTYLYHETWPGSKTSLGIWRASLIFTGILSAVIMLLICFTTLPTIRRNHFNLFYFTHLATIAIIVIACLHASTILYCVAPGLAMWVLDWGMRMYELRELLPGKLATFGKGWYCLSVPIPRRRLDGCACSSPLAHFYVHHSGSSTRELHPFTTITHLASRNSATPEESSTLPIQFLFRKCGQTELKRDNFADSFIRANLTKSILKQKPKPEWTARLGSLADKAETEFEMSPSSPSHLSGASPSHDADLPVRLEGPYFTPVNPSQYRVVVCLVAGTGVSGAIAIAEAFRENSNRKETSECTHQGIGHRRACRPGDKMHVWERCIIVWTTRQDDYVEVPFFGESDTLGLEVQIHQTGDGQPRLNIQEKLAQVKKENTGSMWVYISGPNPFLTAGTQACQALLGIDFYAAKWDI